ncbi:GntR family transcriptional regulator [Petrocella sp. FN5]|uniref:GntR family transcriptional regulator n=1 Tax=Petrocella sp. FN5 TaxID=3032002 RepID=UPI0023DAC02C|nr:GntR family transcriptional regulator [Petrocella sp. FN5]MDF1615930.1 GntR family transcriptional regulator [Petrocella sp. FN5]
MFQVDIRSRIPIYEQMYENIRRLILEGHIKEDEQLPSIRELASLLTVNPNTIQKAFKQLEQDGYIYALQGRGNFAKKLDVLYRNQEIEGVKKKLREIILEAKLLNVPIESLMDLLKDAYKRGESQ